ncbi:hypothetical protein Lepto7376_3094 [[Leptolyngbya] sp. PCC 7376]|uniref:hypothetical protein n=1 Tax=[Leptolyngbya] sp. PCC 7376 TaxID=111781 RepID=UPI00029ED16B|nr:hypothetical protein [[Leptolyngbya] sp. PCC 7376]AFY39331.1 hypothetical protein Lepto7376_3094 [[Leptolyngbya] sp. PCC 7376]
MNILEIFQRKIGSQKILILSVISLWAIAYVIGLGSPALGNPSLIITSLPIAVLMGWMLIPENFLHNVTGLTHEVTPQWFHFIYFFGYWAALIGLHIALFQTRRWVLLVLLAIAILTSTYGCSEFVVGGFDEMG